MAAAAAAVVWRGSNKVPNIQSGILYTLESKESKLAGTLLVKCLKVLIDDCHSK